ncbi:relaxase/mobilization nuclease domain-containing protein [Helicobacter cetorum]|uniref:MobA/VirD2-like nuclease domain-containing protein n=1 Tax=Helicobacter cetorum (strain ATCC BAA-429 / MIT 00-7128) TaxID=182217 RepID=I0EMD8_HELC0|nr:relaxase/mobilization nuclease domain-containing protein [Helicobacter cetorum]AFI04107.1 hypothetical protein HCW_04190 [Helicobacter cetorum MIT 00-7128]
MVATKNNSILEDEEPLFKFEEIKPKKVLRPRTTYTQRLRYALRVANNHIKNNTKPFKSTQKQVVIKNIGNLSIEHTRNAGEYVVKDEEFVLNEFYQEVNLDETLNEWEQDFLITKKHNSKNMAMHLVFSIDEPITEKNLNILQYSVYQTLINHLGYDYPFIIQTHSHQNKPHVHVVLNKTNKLTGKKLHFKSKVECKEFFDDLREDFKDFLFTNSRAELDYSNVPNVEKHLLNIEQEIQELKTKQKETPLNAHSFFDMAFKNFNQALIPLKQQKENLEQQLEILETPTSKTQYNKNLKLLEQHTLTIKKIKDIRDKMFKTLDFKDTFSYVVQNFSVLEKKKALLQSLSSLGKHHYSTPLVRNLNALTNEVKEDSLKIKESTLVVNEYLDFQSLNLKANLFALKKQLNYTKQTQKMLQVLSTNDLPKEEPKQNTPNNDDFTPLFNTLKQREQELLALIKQRALFLITRYQELEKELKDLHNKQSSAFHNKLNDFCANHNSQNLEEDNKLDKLIQRKVRSLNFMQKEILVAKSLGVIENNSTHNKEQNKELEKGQAINNNISFQNKTAPSIKEVLQDKSHSLFNPYTQRKSKDNGKDMF